MVERLIYALIYLCGLALCFYLIVWVLGAIGIVLPHMVVVILRRCAGAGGDPDPVAAVRRLRHSVVASA